jgi:Abortive infection alpha
MSDGSADKSVSLINLGSLAKPVDTLAKGLIDGAGAFLSRICLPAAEEFGLALREKVSTWRTLNAARIAEKAEKKLQQQGSIEGKQAHPRIVWSTLENGSWEADDDVQEMWAGLLASSCTEDGDDESNLIFIHLLGQLTTSEAKVLNYICEQAAKVTNEIGVVGAYTVELTKDRISEITGVSDLNRMIRELDHLNALELIKGRFGSRAESEEDDYYRQFEVDDDWIAIPDLKVANVSPTHLGVSLYVRCQGSLLPPASFFKLSF